MRHYAVSRYLASCASVGRPHAEPLVAFMYVALAFAAGRGGVKPKS